MLTVGVAPGTTTLQLGQVYPGVAAKSINWIAPRPSAPEEKRWFMPDRAEIDTYHVPYPNGFKGLDRTYYNPYANDIWRLRGLGELPAPRIRWDLIGIVGGGAFAVALVTSLIASGLK
jgi:hypothetical protein